MKNIFKVLLLTIILLLSLNGYSNNRDENTTQAQIEYQYILHTDGFFIYIELKHMILEKLF